MQHVWYRFVYSQNESVNASVEEEREETDEVDEDEEANEDEEDEAGKEEAEDDEEDEVEDVFAKTIQNKYKIQPHLQQFSFC